MRWNRVKHHSSFCAMMWTNSVKLIDIREHSSPKIALLVFESHALVATSRDSTMHRVLSLHDSVHVLIINWNSISRRSLSPITWVGVTSLTRLSQRRHHLLLLRSLRVLWSLLQICMWRIPWLSIFFILCHLFHDGCLGWIIETLGVRIILLHLHHLLLLSILLLQHIRVLICIVGILIHHLARILTILLLGVLHVVAVLRELELSSCISRRERLNRRYSIVHRRQQSWSEHCGIVVLLSTRLHLTDSPNCTWHCIVHWGHHHHLLIRISIHQLILLVIHLIVTHQLRVLKLLVLW